MRIDASPLEKKFCALKKKDPVLFNAVQKKIAQIASLEKAEIQHFKNLKYGLRTCKRAHIGSFVLMFRIEGDVLVFDRFEHHDNAY